MRTQILLMHATNWHHVRYKGKGISFKSAAEANAHAKELLASSNRAIVVPYIITANGELDGFDGVWDLMDAEGIAGVEVPDWGWVEEHVVEHEEDDEAA